jgi:isopenicillin-N epimerase
MEEEKSVGFGRRDFLKGAVSTAIAAGVVGLRGTNAQATPAANKKNNGLPDTLQAVPTFKSAPGTEKFWADVRKQAFTLPDDFIHMNTGTTGSQPLFSQVNLAVYNNYKSADPRDWQSNLNADFPDLFPIENSILGASALGPRQAAIAAAYGANPDEIVLSYNTTDACNLIFAGTPWQPGDRIVTTSMEHNAIIGPIAWARDYHGVEVAIIDIPSNFESSITVPEVVSWFEAELARPLPAGAKQYVVFSEIFYKNGVRLPVKQICAAAKSRGAYSIVDSAHAWGMLPVNCHDYGADFIAGAGHKWLCGGPGTGIFYVRNSGSNLPPFAMGNFFIYGEQFTAPSLNYNTRAWQFVPGFSTPPSIAVQLRGENNTPALYAMTDSFALFNSIGAQNIYHRGVALGNYLKQKVEAKWGPGALWVQRNADPSFASFLTSFNPFRGRNDSGQYSAMNGAIGTVLNNLAAQSPKMYLRSTTWHNSKADSADNRVGFRISTHAMYNNFSEIDWMFDKLVAQIDASGLPQL